MEHPCPPTSTLSLSLCLSPSLSLSHSISLSHTHTVTVCLSVCRSLSLSLSLSLARTGEQFLTAVFDSPIGARSVHLHQLPQPRLQLYQGFPLQTQHTALTRLPSVNATNETGQKCAVALPRPPSANQMPSQGWRVICRKRDKERERERERQRERETERASICQCNVGSLRGALRLRV